LVFFWRSLTRSNPVVDLTIFRDRNFAVGSLVAAIVGLGLYGSVFVLPIFLSVVHDYNALQIGQIMSIGGIAMFLGGPVAGFLIRRYDARYVLVLGLALTAIGLYWNQFLTAESSFDELFWPQALRGAGIIIAMVPCNYIALGALPPAKLPNATGLLTVCRNLGGAIGLAALNTMRLNYNNLHTQELSAALDPSRPEVRSWLDEAESRLRMLGESDPATTAIAQLVQRMRLESEVMTFNNLFMAMALAFALMLLLTPLFSRPPLAGAPQAAH